MARLRGIHPECVQSAPIGRDIRTGQGLVVMEFFARIAQLASALREFVAPTYRPERHYMRGPGPACARRGSL